MTIEAPEQWEKAVKRSRVSLARSDPLHPNFNYNLDLNEHNSSDDSTASVNEGMQAIGQKGQLGKSLSSLRSLSSGARTCIWMRV